MLRTHVHLRSRYNRRQGEKIEGSQHISRVRGPQLADVLERYMLGSVRCVLSKPWDQIIICVRENGGLVVGLELSFYRVISIRGEDQGFAGFLVDIDKCKDMTKVHFGIEASYRLVGASIGPSMLFTQDWRGFGMT